MLIPRFSIRWLLIVTAVFAAFFFLVSVAVRGEPWAIAVSVALGSLALLVVIHAGFFLVAWLIAEMIGLAWRPQQPESPFATEKPPPQIVPPTDPGVE